MPSGMSRQSIVALGILALVRLASPLDSQAGFEPARRLRAPDLKPPAQQAGSGIEGWARVCVTVKEDGSVADPRVPDAGPNAAFVDAGRKGALGWSFEPARLDGEPVEARDVCGLQLFTLALAPDAGTTATLAEAERLLDAEDPDGAGRVLGRLAEQGPLTLQQGAELQLLQSRLAADRGDQTAAVDALERATVGGGRFLEEDVAVNALGATFVGLVNERRYREALDLFDRFEEMPGGAQPMVLHGKAAAEIRTLARSGASYAVPARLEPRGPGGRGLWRHRPLRRELGVRKREGEVDALVVACDVRGMRLAYDEDVSWRIPDSWGRCAVYAEGKPGGTFELIEYGIEEKDGGD